MKTKSRDKTGPAIAATWESHYGKLMALREALLQEREIREAGIGRSLPHGGGDAMDRAREVSDHELELGLLSCEDDALKEVEDAIQRIYDGTYGVCEETGKRIPEARLRVVPWTRYTKPARERIERESSQVPAEKPQSPSQS